jgi:hypothetical protein
VKVPFADFNALKLPPGKEHEEDFALLSDIFPTVREWLVSPPWVAYVKFITQGWHGVQLSVCIH